MKVIKVLSHDLNEFRIGQIVKVVRMQNTDVVGKLLNFDYSYIELDTSTLYNSRTLSISKEAIVSISEVTSDEDNTST